MALAWKSAKAEGKHVGWRYADGSREVGYVCKNTADNPAGKPFHAGFYPQPYRFGQGIGWYRTVSEAKRAVENHIAGPGRHLLKARGNE